MISFWRVIFVLCVLALPVSAQLSDEARDYIDNWIVFADEAEKTVDANKATNEEFRELRAKLVKYRDAFGARRGANAERISTMQSQLDALGDEPKEGGEPADIVALRKQLTEQLKELRLPGILAEESYSRANGLIVEIDVLLRNRDKEDLVRHGPIPIFPANWGIAYRDVAKAFATLAMEIRQGFGEADPLNSKKDIALLTIVLAAFGVLLLLRGAHWSDRLGAFLNRVIGRGYGVWGFVVSLARIVFPLVGILLVVGALLISGVLGPQGTKLVEKVPSWLVLWVSYRWLSLRLFPKEVLVDEQSLYSPAQGRMVRADIGALALLLILRDMVLSFSEVAQNPETTKSVLLFGPIILTALVLYQVRHFALQLRHAELDANPDGAGGKFGIRDILEFVQRFILGVVLVAPVLAVAGYVNAADHLIFSTVRSIALFALAYVLLRFLDDVYVWASGRGEAARDSLFSALMGFALAIVSLPLLAMVWGLSSDVLADLWTSFLEGFQIGGIQISPENFLVFVVIFAVGYSVTKVFQSALRNSILPRTKMDAGGQNAVVSGAGYVGIFLAALVAIVGAGFDLSSLAIVAGALSVGIGFGLQTIVSNFVSGIILLIERPISKGDWIEVGGKMGYVADISVRSTRIETFDRTDLIVPNSDLISGTVTNYTRGNTIGRLILPVGVAYGTDTKKVEAILREVAEGHPMVLANPAPNIVFQGFGADSLDFEIRAILRDVNWILSVKSDLNHDIAEKFSTAGIEIPFAQRDIWIRNPESLPGNAPKDDDA